MPIAGGLDIHRKQITFGYLGTVTGQVRRGQIAPAGRVRLRAWLARFAGRDEVAFALEGCAGWRQVAGELAAAGITAHLAGPAGTASARGRERHAKAGKTGSRHLRVLLAEGRRPECRIPPGRILECRALLELYDDLRRERTAWAQRIHAVLFRQGAPAPGAGAPRTGRGAAGLRAAAAAHLSPSGQLQAATALEVTGALEARLHAVRHQLPDAARHLAGAKALAARLYGAGPVTALAITCRPGGAARFSSSRQPARFAGLDITGSSSGRAGPPGKLSRQGPPALRRAVCEAGKARARTSAPGHGCYARVKDRKNSKRACLPEARKILRQARHILAGPGGDALAAAWHTRHGDQHVTAAPRPAAAGLTRWGPPRPAPARPLSAAAGPHRPGGRPDQAERPHPRRRGRPVHHHVTGAQHAPRGPG